MISIFNNINYNLYRQNLLSSKVTGIWETGFFLGSSAYPIFPYFYITSNFSNFEKNVYNNIPKITYHLSGYGENYEESLISFIGESSERYAYGISKKLIPSSYIEKKSYSEMKKQYKDCLITPLNYVNSLYSKIDRQNYIGINDRIQWLKMNSLIKDNQYVWIPLQQVLLYDEHTFKNEKRYYTSAVSTGTASHENIIDSLKNSIIEYLQLDSFNLWWYCGIRDTEKDSFNGNNFIKKIFNNDSQIIKFFENFDVIFTNISFDKNIYIYVCEIFAKNKYLPQYTVGLQGGIDKIKCLYRSFMEAITVLEYSQNLSWLNYEKFNNNILHKNIPNLDDNILKYNILGKPKLKTQNITFKKPDIAKNNKELISSLSNYSKYAGFLNITPIGFKDMNLNITRVFIPELLPMFLPDYPAKNHPRIKQFGGVLNKIAHPLA